jgi:hypothetical protein
MAAEGERFLAGPTGLEPATSGVTGPWSRVFREEAIYIAWDKSLKPRYLALRNRNLASHLASLVRLARCNDSCAWNTASDPWNIRGATSKRGLFRQERSQVLFVEHADEIRYLAIESDRQADDRSEAWHSPSALHVADVRVRHSSQIGERSERKFLLLSALAQAVAEDRRFLQNSRHALCRSLTN